MKVRISTMEQVTVTIYQGTSKKTGKSFECVKLEIGEYSTLIFPTPFELKYIKEQLGA
jgi:hypothetical protein